jgi:hypothetical protein
VRLPELWPAEKRSTGARELGGLAKQLAKRDDEGMEDPKNEREFYRRIITRAKTVRERAAESLRQSRVLRKEQGDARSQPNAAPKRRRFRRPD